MKSITAIFALSILLCLCSGCGAKDIDGATEATGYWSNPTSHTITVQVYRSWGNPNEGILVLAPGTTVQIGQSSAMGKQSLGGGFVSAYLIEADSAVVRFENGRQSSHYGFQPSSVALSSYEYLSQRNIFQIKSYAGEVLWETKYSQANKYTYTFTEQDFLNAK